MSASIHNMCSTPDYGCVHVVADNQYQGKIEGWNDPFGSGRHGRYVHFRGLSK